MATDKLHDLVRMIYESSVDARQWPVFLDSYSRAIGALFSGLIAHDHQDQRGNVNLSVGIDPYWEAKYAEYYSSTNVWILRGRSFMVPGELYDTRAMVPQNELLQSEFYNDFLKPQDNYYCMGGTILEEGSQFAGLTSTRRKKAGAFSENDQAVLGTLLPHLQTAMQIHRRVAVLESGISQSHAALDKLSSGVILIDGKGHMLFANRRASEALQAKDGLSLAPDGLRAETPHETLRLRALISDALRVFRNGAKAPKGRLSLSRPNGRSPLRLFVAPLPPTIMGLRSDPAVAIFISALDWYPVPSPDLFERLLDLTPAESRIASALAMGKTLQEYAHESGVAISTIRSHLKHVYSKLGVTRQTDLMRILLSLGV